MASQGNDCYSVYRFSVYLAIGLEIPERITDFIQGRVARSIGAKHYMVLKRQADKFYGKYADYLGNLRASVTQRNMADKAFRG